MKQPRLADFDPNAAEHELGSPLDDMPTIEKPKAAPKPVTVNPTQPKKAVASPTVAKPTPSRSDNRERAKRTFGVFADQLDYLLRESLAEKLDGKDGSQDAMVREALDDWISRRKSTKK